MFAHPHRHGAGHGVRVVGRADRDGIDALAHLVEHLAIIVVPLGIGIFLGRLVEGLVVDVADGDHVARLAGVARVALALASHADAGEVDLFVGRLAFLRLRAAGDPESRARHGGREQEVATIGGVAHIKNLRK
jgi:hypothetical protein